MTGRRAGILLALLLPGLSVVRGPSSAQPAVRPPNIILILADDLGWSDLGVQGSRYYDTPHLDALAERGTRFTAAYANAPNCAPSRASLLTGLDVPRHGIYTVANAWRGPRDRRRLAPPPLETTLAVEARTLADVLTEAGYASAHMGKWHLGAPGEAGPREQGFETNVAGTHEGHPPTYFSPYRIPTLEDGPAGEYLTDRITEEAVAWVEAHRDRPFFLHLAHYAVHTPIEAPAATVARFLDRPAWHGQADPTYAAMVHHLDHSVGRVVETIDRLGLAEETIIVFTSDNGGLGGYASSGLPGSRRVTDNHPLKGGKGQLYEGGIRVPLLMAGPGIPAGRVETTPVIGSDLFPTLLGWAGAPVPQVDGSSLAPLLAEPPGVLGRDALYWYFPAYLQAYGRAGDRTTPAAAVRRGDLKLVWFFEDDRVELYDLAADPGERLDLARVRPSDVRALRQRLSDWLDVREAPRPTPNPLYRAPAH